MDTQNPPMPTDNPTPSEPTTPAAKQPDHWFVQVVGGVTLTNTIVSALAIFYVFMAFSVFQNA